jgi:hypothetical protein
MVHHFFARDGVPPRTVVGEKDGRDLCSAVTVIRL